MDGKIGRAKAIRLKCLDCCCGNSAEVRRCRATNCPLWRWRMGKEDLTENPAKMPLESANGVRVS